ncbi:hypothetical protein [Thermococcus profundus]|nr:hypothetical protein [Thermococcus profundus]
MNPFLYMDPESEGNIKKAFANPDENQISLIREGLKEGIYDKEFGLGYGFMTHKNIPIHLTYKDKEEDLLVKWMITLPYHAIPSQSIIGEVEFEVSPYTYGNKVLEAIALGAILPNFHTWEFRLRAGKLTDYYTIPETNTEAAEVYPLLVLDSNAGVMYRLPYLMSEVIKLDNMHYHAKNDPYFSLDEAFSMVLQAFQNEYPVVSRLKDDAKATVLSELLYTFAMQMAGAVLAGLVEPGPFVKTGYNAEVFEDQFVRDVIDWFWGLYRYPYVDWEKPPVKEVDDLFADVAIAGFDTPETFKNTVLFNLDVGADQGIVLRGDWEFVRKYIPDFEIKR